MSEYTGFTSRQVPELPPNPFTYQFSTVTVDGQEFKYAYEYTIDADPYQVTNTITTNLTIENKLYDKNFSYGKRNYFLTSRPDGVEWRSNNMRIMSTAMTHGAYFNPCAYTPRIEIDTALNSIDSRVNSLENP